MTSFWRRILRVKRQAEHWNGDTELSAPPTTQALSFLFHGLSYGYTSHYPISPSSTLHPPPRCHATNPCQLCSHDTSLPPLHAALPTPLSSALDRAVRAITRARARRVARPDAIALPLGLHRNARPIRRRRTQALGHLRNTHTPSALLPATATGEHQAYLAFGSGERRQRQRREEEERLEQHGLGSGSGSGSSSSSFVIGMSCSGVLTS